MKKRLIFITLIAFSILNVTCNNTNISNKICTTKKLTIDVVNTENQTDKTLMKSNYNQTNNIKPSSKNKISYIQLLDISSEIASEDICENDDLLRVIYFIWSILSIILKIVPIGAILMISFDFLKNVIASNDGDMKKNFQLALKRILSCVIVFLVPSLVSFTNTLLGNNGVNYSKCLENIANGVTPDDGSSRFEDDYTSNNSNLGGGGSGITVTPGQGGNNNSSENKNVSVEAFLNTLDKMSKQVEKDYKNGKAWKYKWNSGAGKYQATFETANTTNKNATCICIPSWALIELGILQSGDILEKSSSSQSINFRNQFVRGSNGKMKKNNKETEERAKAGLDFIDGKMKSASSLIKAGTLKKGDIVFWSYYHVSVYAGDGKWYDAGRGNPKNINQYTFTTWGPVKMSTSGTVYKIARIKEK